jgi:hypothetical protein
MSATTTARKWRWRRPAIRIFSAVALCACIALVATTTLAADRAGEKSDPSTIAGGPAYVRLDPIFVPIIAGDEVTQQVGVTVMLQLVEGKDKSDVEAKRLLLYDALFRDLYSYFQDRVAASGRIDETYLKARLLKTSIAVVGPDLVNEVLIEQLFARPK